MMKTFIAASAALAMIAGATVANAQSSEMNRGTPGAGSAGQDQRPMDQGSPNSVKNQPNTSDAPRGQNMPGGQGMNSGGAASNGMAPSPTAGDDRSNGPRH